MALASLVVYPELRDIEARFPRVDPSILQHDLAYPAMLVLVPHGLLGLVVASLAAANQYVDNQYASQLGRLICRRRFLPPLPRSRNFGMAHYVSVGRIVAVGLMVLAALVALWLENAMHAFQILLQIGAGTGLIFLLRWFWWRINAWGESAAMVIPFVVALYFQFGHTRLGLALPDPSVAFVVGVLITTLGWLTVTLLTPPTDRATLQAFCDRIRPAPQGWRRAVDTGGGRPEPAGSPAAGFLAWFLGTIAVYAALFATGFLVNEQMELRLACMLIAVTSAVGLWRTIPRVGFWPG